MRRAGSAKPEATSAARTRSRASDGQSHDVEGRQPRRDLHLDIDGTGLDALKRYGSDALDHAAPARGQEYRKPC
jgi:hypothetical protein